MSGVFLSCIVTERRPGRDGCDRLGFRKKSRKPFQMPRPNQPLYAPESASRGAEHLPVIAQSGPTRSPGSTDGVSRPARKQSEIITMKNFVNMGWHVHTVRFGRALSALARNALLQYRDRYLPVPRDAPRISRRPRASHHHPQAAARQPCLFSTHRSTT